MLRNKLFAGAYENEEEKKNIKKQSSIADYETGDAVFCSFSEIVIK